jgi:hypothetical protein
MTIENSENDFDNDNNTENEEQIIPRKIEKMIPVRQTLLFSATALQIEAVTKKNSKDKKWLDKVKIKGIGGGAVKALPLHLQQLLAVVAVMGNTHVAGACFLLSLLISLSLSLSLSLCLSPLLLRCLLGVLLRFILLRSPSLSLPLLSPRCDG